MDQETAEGLVAGVKAAVAMVAKVNDTLLAGWHHQNYTVLPTKEEAFDIVSIHDELMLMGKFSEDEEIKAWQLAGQLVQRCHRDRNARNHDGP